MSIVLSSANRNAGSIRIGLAGTEPIRLTGLASTFEQPARQGHVQMLPTIGSLAELMAASTLQYLVIDLHSSSSVRKALETIRRARPDMRLIVIGPEGNDELVLEAIGAGARAYLDQKAGPEILRRAVEVVTEGLIWAPRRLLSKMIDRLMHTADTSVPVIAPQLTLRERQVLELILMAHSNREIASQLGIEERTVRAHLGRLMRKAGVDNRIKLSLSARKLFLLPEENDEQQNKSDQGRSRLTN
jgi:DNA-binding NarL/FixJ family response regulator